MRSITPSHASFTDINPPSTDCSASNEYGGTLSVATCWSLVLGGGGIKGGQVVGASDAKGAQVAEKIVSIGDVFATIYDAFGIDWEKEYMTPTGRPIKIANAIGDKTGSLISELV